MDDLTAFLKARFDDDDEREAQRGVEWLDESTATPGNLDWAAQRAKRGDVRQIGGYLPDRVLREVEAKRRIVDEYDAALRILDGFRETGHEEGRREALELACRALALPYADHADYREGWKP